MTRRERTGGLSAIFGCLADPTRREILSRLAGRTLSVTELAEPFTISLPAVSRHIRMLQAAGLIRRARRGRVHQLSLDARPMEVAARWIRRYERFWKERLDALEKFLET